MVTRLEWIHERRNAAELLEEFNRQACIHFAEVLRDYDTYVRLCKELGKPHEELIPSAYFDAVYRILSFGKFSDRAVILLGTPDQYDDLISAALRQRGFYDENSKWMEL